MAIHVLNITHKELFNDYKTLYRFVPVERLLQILIEKQITFVNPELWEDPFEKMYISGTYNVAGTKKTWPLRNKIFSLCWTKTAASEAFWKGYTPLNDGVRISLNTEKFAYYLESFHEVDVYVGRVDYRLTNDILRYKKDKDYMRNKLLSDNPYENLELLLLKRKTFKYEDEIRFILIPRKKIKENKFYHVPLNPIDFFMDFQLHPRLGLYHAEIIRDYLKRETSLKVSHSRLYTERIIEIDLS